MDQCLGPGRSPLEGARQGRQAFVEVLRFEEIRGTQPVQRPDKVRRDLESAAKVGPGPFQFRSLTGELLGSRDDRGDGPLESGGATQHVGLCPVGIDGEDLRGQRHCVVKALLPYYEDTIKDPDIGIPFQEAYNMDTLEPIPEWEAMYDNVKNECIDIGIPLSPW